MAITFGSTITPDEFYEKLTKRQRQICALVALGLNTSEIGKILNIARHTANKPIIDACHILELDDRVKLAVYIVRHPKLEQKLRATLPDIFAKDKAVTP